MINNFILRVGTLPLIHFVKKQSTYLFSDVFTDIECFYIDHGYFASDKKNCHWSELIRT